MTVELIVHKIGRMGDPAATVTSRHQDAHWATHALYEAYGPLNIRGGPDSGTIGSMTGEVFQASHCWVICPVGQEDGSA